MLINYGLMKNFFLAFAAGLLLAACTDVQKGLDYNGLNARAQQEYLEPVRPGYEGENPFWNGFAKKFIYAPAFDFAECEGAECYRFTVKGDEGSWTFTADSPKAPLTPIWNDVAVGDVELVVEALDVEGRTLRAVGTREFLRDFPFSGPYASPSRDYRQAAVMGLMYIHKMPEIRHWLENTEPDMSYSHNTYPCKIIGATIRAEVLLASLVPSVREDAEKIARNAAQFLIDQSRPADAPLAYFPPTYYKDLVASKRDENQNKTMMMEAASAGNAFLDLFNLTQDSTYFNHAVGIADTYLRQQREDGSFPIKVDFISGEPVNSSCAMLGTLLSYLLRLHNEYGLDRYEDMRKKGETWMRDVALKAFDMTGQFEDVTVLGLQPYENLTNCTAAPYATYLLSREGYSSGDLEYAEDLVRFSEDQFVFWDMKPNEYGYKPCATPCVYEQYKYQKPVDASVCNVSNAMLSLYEQTGDKLYYAKAKALIDNITIVQNAVNGKIPTTWDFRKPSSDMKRTFWINCSYSSAKTLLRMHETEAL